MGTALDYVKLSVGTILEVLAPGLARDIETGRHSGRNIRAKRWILYAKTRRAARRGDARGTQRALFDFWRADVSNSFYDRYVLRFRKWFLGPHHEIVDELEKLAGSREFRQFVEVGCGDGLALEHCAERLPRIPRFVGVDINPSIIERNRSRFAENPRLTFVAANAADWLDENVTDGTILFTYGGVMEYFDADALRGLFASLARRVGTAVALVEPLDPEHDLAGDSASHIFGAENSFSHNHAGLLREAGFAIQFQKELRLDGIRWMMLVAATES